MKKVYIIHENSEWVVDLKRSLEDLNTPYEEWFVNDFSVDLNSTPPEGIFYNRMSASSHTRNHRFAPEITAPILSWLELNQRKILNGRKALNIELSKSEQYFSLNKYGIKTPRSIIVNSIEGISNAVNQLNSFPFIVKPNRGGKGSGVQLFQEKTSLDLAIEEQRLGDSIDGIWIVQEYIKPSDGTITRVEFINGKFHYAVGVDATGGFELCPSDVCNIEDSFCPIGERAQFKFNIRSNYENSDLEKYRNFLINNDIAIGALEYSKDMDGIRYVYDVNTNTNYNSTAEQRDGNVTGGMRKIAEELTNELNIL